MLSRLATAAMSLLIALLIVESVARTSIPLVTTQRYYSDSALGLRLVPSQEGFYGHGAIPEFYAHYRVNHHGWNSSYEYQFERTEALRVAVIGDSFVEAMQVDTDQAFPEIAQAIVNDSGKCGEVEIYRFGVSGAPLSHYARLLDYVMEYYQPDYVVVLLISNDFDESLVGVRDMPYFWRVESVNGFREVAPVYRDASPVRPYQTATGQWLGENLRPLYTQPPARGKIPDEELIQAFIRHELKTMQAIAGQRLILMRDFDRGALYGDSSNFPAHWLTSWRDYAMMVDSEIGRADITYLNIEQQMTADYQRYHRPFEYRTDAHWNVRGHRVVGELLADWLEMRCERGF